LWWCTHMRGTGIEEEAEICATNIANKTKWIYCTFCTKCLHNICRIIVFPSVARSSVWPPIEPCPRLSFNVFPRPPCILHTMSHPSWFYQLRIIFGRKFRIIIIVHGNRLLQLIFEKYYPCDLVKKKIRMVCAECAARKRKWKKIIRELCLEIVNWRLWRKRDGNLKMEAECLSETSSITVLRGRILKRGAVWLRRSESEQSTGNMVMELRVPRRVLGYLSNK
jgi:hypothetical protein